MRNKVADKIGAVVIAYIIGLIVGNVGLIPESFSDFQNSFAESDRFPFQVLILILKGWQGHIESTEKSHQSSFY